MNCQKLSPLAWVVLACLALWMGACSHLDSKSRVTRDIGPKNSPEQGMEILSDNAKAKRDTWKEKTFEEFKAQVYKEPFEGGKFIVNGDTAIVDEKHLQEFFDIRIKKEFQPSTGVG